MEEMNARQRRFAEAYLETGDAALASARAGYSPRYARRALRTRAVRRYLEACQARDEPDEGAPVPVDGEADRVASAQEVLEYLTGVMRGEAESEGRSGGASPRMKAAELLGKRLGVFNEAAEAAEAPVIIDDIRPQGWHADDG